MEFIVGLHGKVWWLHVFLPISGVINKTETLYNSTSQLSLLRTHFKIFSSFFQLR